MVKKKATKEKNPTKKEVDNIKLDFAEDELKHKKRVYGVYIEVLVKYNIDDVAYAAIQYDDLLNKILMRKIKSMSGNHGAFGEFMFGKRFKTKLEEVNSTIKYYDSLIKIVQSNIEHMTTPIKTKIAKDAVEKQHAWLNIPEDTHDDSQQEKCGDTPTHQHRHGTHSEEGKVSRKNDMATVDARRGKNKKGNKNNGR